MRTWTFIEHHNGEEGIVSWDIEKTMKNKNWTLDEVNLLDTGETTRGAATQWATDYLHRNDSVECRPDGSIVVTKRTVEIGKK